MIMQYQLALSSAVLFTGVCCLISKETKEFDCCNLPINISVNRSKENEFSIGNESKVIISGTTFDATPPFKTSGDEVVTLDQCVDFLQKNIYLNEKGETEEKHIHHRCKPCDRTTTPTTTATTTPINTPTNNHTGLITAIVVLVVIGSIVIVVIIGCC